MGTQSRQNKRGNGRGVERALVWQGNTPPDAPVSWAEVDAATLVYAICSATAAGAALMFSCTSDNGAFVLMVLDQDDKVKQYPHTVPDVEALLTSIAEFYQERLQHMLG